MPLTKLEASALSVLLDVCEYFTPGRHTERRTYQEVMGRVRDMIRRLENPEHRCPTGLHYRERCPCRSSLGRKAA
jgi:hypothetical protein